PWIEGSGTREERELAAVIKTHHPFAPATLRLYELPDRQGVEQFVANDEQRALWQLSKATIPPQRRGLDGAGERCLLYGNQTSACFDQAKPRLCNEGGIELRHRTQQVFHECPAPRSDFRHDRFGWRACISPG